MPRNMGVKDSTALATSDSIVSRAAVRTSLAPDRLACFADCGPIARAGVFKIEAGASEYSANAASDDGKTTKSTHTGHRAGAKLWCPAMATITGVAPTALRGSLRVVRDPAAIGTNTRRPLRHS